MKTSLLKATLRNSVLAVLTLAAWPPVGTAAPAEEPAQDPAAAAARGAGAIRVNLGDYAKGDGTDETDAIQKAFDAFNVKQPNQKHDYEFRERKGVLFIPAPPKFYGISRAINIMEKANLVIRCETPRAAGMHNTAYFRWLGDDGGAMFFFNFAWGLRV